MRFKKQPRKFSKSCNNQLVLDFENPTKLVVNIHIPKHSTINTSKNSKENQRFTIRLCES